MILEQAYPTRNPKKPVTDARRVAEIEVHEPTKPGGSFLVTVRDDATTTQHRVRVPEEYAQRIAPEVEMAALVEASFRFLLTREAKESILEEFDLPMIEQYFSDFPDRIQDHL